MPTKNLDISTYALIRALPFAAAKIKLQGTAFDPEKTENGKIIEKCYLSFRYFLRFWQFKNRETGVAKSFEALSMIPSSAVGVPAEYASEAWLGQHQLVNVMEEHPWLFALKAGKLGFSELECAFDGWSLLFKNPSARVHIFSKDAGSAKSFLQVVKFGLTHLPEWMRPTFLSGEAGGETSEQLMMTVPWTVQKDPDDKRTLVSYATSESVAIDQSAQHSHIDELSHWKADPKTAYQGIQSTVPDNVGATLHVITRGHGDKVYTAELWKNAKKKESRLYPFFAPYDMRPDRDPNDWRKDQEENYTVTGLSHFAPMTEEDALAGDDTSIYIPVPVWRALKEDYWDREADPKNWDGINGLKIPVLKPGDKTPCVLAIDAGVSSDMFAAVLVSRDPRNGSKAAIRKIQTWNPHDFGGKRVDFSEVERELRMWIMGGCANGHPLGKWKEDERRGCPFCPDAERKNGPGYVPKYNVLCLTYDPYQLEDMMQRFTTENVVWCDPFNQGTPRLIADRDLWNMAVRGDLVHDGNQELEDHVSNAQAKLQKDQDSTMRIIKRVDYLKIDLLVATSMGVYMCMFLNLPK